MGSNLTIKDVARLSGYSVRTVSRVINNEGYVKHETREKIESIIKDTGFETNIFAKSLRKKIVSNIILVIEKDSRIHPGPFYTSMFQHVINEAATYGYNVFMMEYDVDDDNKNKRSIQLLKSNFVDGAIIFAVREDDPKVNIFKELNISFVAMSKNNIGDYPYVVMDNYKSSYMAGKYLKERECKEYIYIGGKEEYVFNVERKMGFIDSINGESLKLYSNTDSFEDAYNTVCKLEDFRKPLGIFVTADEMAFGVLKALNDMGIKVPSEAMVIGFDDIPLSAYSIPALTTMKQDTRAMARKAVEILNNMINNKSDKIITQEIFEPEMVVRETTI